MELFHPRKPKPTGEFTVGYVGRLMPEKGIADLLTALRDLEEVKALIIGSGPDEPELRRLAGRHNILAEFVAALPQEDLPDWYSRMDILVLPSRTTRKWAEQFGRVLVEAADQKGEFINFLDAQVGVVFPDKRQQVVPLEQVGPGRYRAAFDAAAEGAYLVGVAQRKEQRVVGSELGSLVVPYSPEHRQIRTNDSLLQEVAAITGGTVGDFLPEGPEE